MNEEINIIELLQRVKEGKAPKVIEIKGYRYKFNKRVNYYREGIDGETYYLDVELSLFDMIIANTKIKILDKPIIEPLQLNNDLSVSGTEIIAKIKEIIDYINNKE